MSRQNWDLWAFGVIVAAFAAWWYWFKDSAMLQNLADAIFQFESGGKQTSLAVRNNNPGNLRPPGGKGNFWPGQTGVSPSGGYAVFSSFDAGLSALLGDLKIKARKHPDWTLLQLFRVWLGGTPDTNPPAKEGDALAYAKYVAQKLGVSINTTLKEIAG